MAGQVANNPAARPITIFTNRTPHENFVPNRAAFEDAAAGNFGGIFVLNADVRHPRGADVGLPLAVVLASVDRELVKLNEIVFEFDLELAELRAIDNYDNNDYQGLVAGRAANADNAIFLGLWRAAAARQCPIAWNAGA